MRVVSPEFNGNDPELWTTDHSSWLRMVARLKRDASVDAAAAEAAVLYRTAGPRTRDKELKGTFLWDALQPGRSTVSNVSAKIALWLSAGAALLLLLVTANLINLFVARDAVRARQIAVRLAIGGGWRDIMRLQVVESVILAACAATIGLVVAGPAVGVARALLMPGLTWSQPPFDLRVGALAFGLAAGVGILLSLWTTLQSARIHPASLLRGAGSTQSSDARRAHAVRRTLLVVQAAVFAVLLTSAAAFVTSLRRASAVDFGFDPTRILAAPFNLPAETPRAEVRALLERAQRAAAAVPGIESVSLGYMEPWRNNTGMPLTVPGLDAEAAVFAARRRHARIPADVRHPNAFRPLDFPERRRRQSADDGRQRDSGEDALADGRRGRTLHSGWRGHDALPRHRRCRARLSSHRRAR